MEASSFVNHVKLIDYGIATSERSGDIKKRLDVLGLDEGADYVLRHVSQNSPNGGRPSKAYMLTPDAFKVSLMRAQRRPNQKVDPIKYAKYYLFLESVVKHYGNYQSAMDKAQIAQLAESNGMMREENEAVTKKKNKYKSTVDVIFDKLEAIESSNKDLLEKAKRDEARADRAEAGQNKVLAKLDSVVEMLQQKSIVSTMNAQNPALHHNFVTMGYEFTDNDQRKGRKIALIAGQEVNVRKAMREKFNDPAHTWTVQIGMHYNANPIDLRNNICDRVKSHIYDFVARENVRRVNLVQQQNDQLREEINQFNASRPKGTGKRSFAKEKIQVVKLARSDIPITWNKATACIIENEFISYDDLLEIIRTVNEETQTSPYQSDASED